MPLDDEFVVCAWVDDEKDAINAPPIKAADNQWGIFIVQWTDVNTVLTEAKTGMGEL